MMGTSGQSVATETIADEQRLSSFANAIIGVSFLILNDLEAEEQISNTLSKGGTEVSLGNHLLIVLGLVNHE
jgi:hypothetical protein